MNLDTLGFIIHTLGELMVAFSVLIVHHRVSAERKIDIHVRQAMKWERLIVFLGIAFIIAGALIEKLF